jgi:hypothetical protein
MIKLELLTKGTIDSLLAQQGPQKARVFLDRNFGVLSEPELQALTEPVPPEKGQAAEKILEDLKRDQEGLKASKLRSFVQKKFPFLEEDAQREFILELSQPVPAIPTRRPPWLRIELLIDQALGILPLVMDEEQAYQYLQEEFPSLTGEDLKWLAQPVAIKRQKAMDKLVRHVGDEVREQKVGNLSKMLKTKFREIDREEAEQIFPDIVRKIPPRRPKPPEKQKPPEKTIPPRRRPGSASR